MVDERGKNKKNYTRVIYINIYIISIHKSYIFGDKFSTFFLLCSKGCDCTEV